METDNHLLSGYDLARRIFNKSRNDAVSNFIELASDETCWLEFKAAMHILPKDQERGETQEDMYWHIARAVIAMMNSSGGVVVIGVKDISHEVVGLASSDPNNILSQKGIEAYLRQEVQERLPPIKMNWTTTKGPWSFPAQNLDNFVTIEKAKYQGKDVALVFVSPIPRCQPVNHGKELVLLIRSPGAIGKVEELTGWDKIQNYMESREIRNEDYRGQWKQFLELHRIRLPRDVLYGHNFREKLFIGRNDALAVIREKMKDTGIVIIRGAAGNGKTSIAARIANDWCANEFGYAFWIDAEHLQDWEMIFGAVEQLDTRIRSWLDEDVASRMGPEGSIGHRVAKGLERKCETGHRILLVLDNVETTEIFSDDQIKEWFPNQIPQQLHILATSRFDATGTHVENPVFQYNLGYLPLSTARELLVSVLKDARRSDLNEKDLSDDERKALDDLVSLTHGHAWTIKVIGGFMAKTYATDDVFTAPMSFGAALELYEKQGLSEFSPDDPLLIKKFLAPTLDRIRQRRKDGAALFDLARFAALVASDGISETHLLRAFWKKTTKGSEASFKRALGTLVGCSLFDPRSETAIEMHRNTQDVLREEIDSVFLDRVGSFLSTYPGLELRHWPELLQNGVPSDFCPVRLLDNALLRKILPFDWSLLDAELIEDFNGEDICWALLNGPETIRNLPWRWDRLEETGSSHVRFSTFFPNPLSKTNDPCFPCSPRGDFRPAYWTNVLLKIPSLIRHCDLSQLSHDDLWVLTKAMPTLVDENPFFRETPRGIVHYLMSHPDAATDQMLSSLDPEDWQFLVHERKQFDGQMPSAVRSLLERVSNARERGYGNDDCEFEDEYESGWYEEPEQTPEDREEERIQEQFGTFIPSKEDFLSSESGREIAVYLMLHPQDSHLRSLETLESDDWLVLFAERPEFIEEYGTKQVLDASSSAWVEALSDNPELVNECGSEFELSGGWDMFSGEDWVNLLLSRPELGSHCNASKLNGQDWGKLLVRYPSLAEKCPWKKLSESDYAALLVSHPEWAKNYGLSFSGLNEEQWIELLRHHPEFGDQCHIRFSEKSAFDLALLVKEQPVLLNALSAYGSMSLFDPLLLFARGDDGALPWYYLIRKTIREKSEPKVDFYDEWQNHKLPIRWDALSCSEWDWLLERHPECVDIFNKKKVWLHFSGADWTSKLLSNLPEWFDRCDWTKLTGDDWIRLLAGGQDRDDFGFFFDENGIIQRGRLIKGRRQLVRNIPEGVSIEALMKIATSVPMSKRLLKNNPFVQAIFDSAKSHLEENLQSKQTTIPLKPNEIVWPHMDWVPFCHDTKCISVPNLLQSLVKGIDSSYRPHETKQKLDLLSKLVFECQDISAADICVLERTIAETQLEHGFFEDALVVLDHIPSFVEAETSSDFDAGPCDLSLAISDCFYHYCRGDAFWEMGEFQKAVACFSNALSASQVRFEERVFHLLRGKPTPNFRFSQRSFNGSSMWISQSISGEQILYDPHFDVRSISRIKQDLSDCKELIPCEYSVSKWFDRLNRSFDPHPNGREAPEVPRREVRIIRRDLQF